MKEHPMPQYLPVGIQDFEKMILGDFLYVDKTRHIYEMARPLQGFYFLARPRRFGKSLLISTFENLFKGKEALFKGLWIEKSDWDWKPYPVIKIDFSSISSRSPESLEADLKILVRQTAQSLGLASERGSLPWRFSRLIVDLAEKSGAPVVILMDEYDKPIIEHLGKGPSGIELAKKNREILRSFFGVIKSGDVSSALRFVFITGISKFARVSIFSDLNNLNDITMRERYADLLGYTAEELSAFFDSCIQSLSAKLRKDPSQILKKIEHWYDGYRFTESEIRVYNPFSVVRMFDAEKFENYWFETATPAFLVHLIREKQYPVTDVESLKLPREYFSVYDLDRLSLEPLLFQTGYITIRHYDEILFHMGYPNQEVRVSFLSYLFNDLTQLADVRLSGAYKLLPIHLEKDQPEAFIETVQSILAAIPYSQIAGQDEAYYHTVFYLMLAASGADVRTEVLTSHGRIDLMLTSEDRIYIIELKCNRNSKAAIRQILEKKYYQGCIHGQKKIFLMGINFNTEKRTVDDWQWGPLADFTEI